MSEILFDVGFTMLDFGYTLLESIQLRCFPPIAPPVTLRPTRFQTSDPFQAPRSKIRNLDADADEDDFEPLRVLIIGSTEGVTETIHNLHVRGFAEARAWSPLLPAPTTGEVMSILSRQRRK
jgi:hypothetical protein